MDPSPVAFLRLTSGATPADLLTARVAAGQVPYMRLAEVGCAFLLTSVNISFCYHLK